MLDEHIFYRMKVLTTIFSLKMNTDRTLDEAYAHNNTDLSFYLNKITHNNRKIFNKIFNITDSFFDLLLSGDTTSTISFKNVFKKSNDYVEF